MAVFKKRGKWWIGYRRNGKWRREPVGASYTLAREVLTKRLAEVAEQKYFPERFAQNKTFGGMADKYWVLHGQYLRSVSWKLMMKEIEGRFGAKMVGHITTGEIQGYYNEVAERTSCANANRYLTLIRSVYNKAKAWGDFYGDNPCNGAKKGREAAHRLRYLARDEIDRLLSTSHPRLYPILVCALMTGMRRGEILGLAWENINLSRDILYVLKSKSGKPREIPISSKLKEVLTSLNPKPEGPVFDLPVIMLRRYFDRALKQAEIHGFRFHDLRHTFAAHFIMRTNDLPALQALLGHSTPAMTMRYAHLSREHLKANMIAFEAAIPVSAPQLVRDCTKDSTTPLQMVLQNARNVL